MSKFLLTFLFVLCIVKIRTFKSKTLFLLFSFKINLDVCFQFIFVYAIMWTYFMSVLYEFF